MLAGRRAYAPARTHDNVSDAPGDQRACRCWFERHTNRNGSRLLNLDRTQVATTIHSPGRVGFTLPYSWLGPNTLLTALKTDADFRDQLLPSRARIARLLKQEGVTRRYQPHHDFIQPPRVPLSTPHQEGKWTRKGSCEWKG